MWWSYTMLILCVLLIYRWWQMKQSIKKGTYDYSYYEDGPYGEKKRKLTLIEKIKKLLGIR